MKIYRHNIQIIDLTVDDNSTLRTMIMGDQIIDLNVTIPIYTDFQINDYLIYDAVIFRMNNLPKVTKQSNNQYSYNLRFEAPKYDLSRILVKLDGTLEFPLSATIEQILDLILENTEIAFPAQWVKGVCSITPFTEFDIANENCLQLLTRACQQFEVEYEVVVNDLGKFVLNVRDVIGVATDLIFSYKTKGIQSLIVSQNDQIPPTTKLYAFGGNQNIPANYGKNRITIPPVTSSLIGQYGISEAVVTWEDVFPRFAGVVDSLSYYITTFYDNGIDFDLNAYLIPGVSPKVTFLDGSLAGYEFEISTYNHSTKEVTLLELINDIAVSLPNSTTAIQTGDKYTFTDIYMPPEYITAAENELKTRAEAYLLKYQKPLTKLEVRFDPHYFLVNQIHLTLGDKITILDAAMNIITTLRIYQLTQSLANPYIITAQLTDTSQMSRMLELTLGQYDISARLSRYKREMKIIKLN